MVSIVHLKSLCRTSPTLLTDEMTISGIVTANDFLNEFPKTLIVEDETGGIEIAIDHTRLKDLYPVGCRITVSCPGLALGDYGGKIRLGAQPAGTYDIDRIPAADVGRYIRRTGDESGLTPHILRFDEVGPAQIDTYVRFEGIRFADAGSHWCEFDPETGETVTTERTATDEAGNEFAVRIAAECDYAIEPIPQGTGSINGVIDYFNGEYSLRIVNFEIFFATFAARPTACPSTGGY